MLTKHFSLLELISTSVEGGLESNLSSVSFEELRNLKNLASFLECIRVNLVKGPLYINSGYRSKKVNAAVGGVANSIHREGLAADVRCEDSNSTYRLFKELPNSPYRDFLRELIYYSDREVPLIHLALKF